MNLLLTAAAFMFSGGAFLYSSGLKKENRKLIERPEKLEKVIK